MLQSFMHLILNFRKVFNLLVCFRKKALRTDLNLSFIIIYNYYAIYRHAQEYICQPCIVLQNGIIYSARLPHSWLKYGRIPWIENYYSGSPVYVIQCMLVCIHFLLAHCLVTMVISDHMILIKPTYRPYWKAHLARAK